MDEYDGDEFSEEIEDERLSAAEIAEKDAIHFGPQIAVERDMLESFVPALGLTVNEEGKLEDYETGKVMVSPEGEELTMEEIGYLGYDEENSQVEPVRDDKSAIVAYLKDLEFFWD